MIKGNIVLKGSYSEDQERDPLVIFKREAVKNKIIKESEFKKIEMEIKKSIEKDVEWSLSQEDQTQIMLTDLFILLHQ